MLSAERFSGLKGTFLPMAELAGLTWMRVGGPADWLFSPQDISDLQTFLKQCPADVQLTCLGAGSNSLIRDGGIAGVVIHLSAYLTRIKHNDTVIHAEAGCADSEVARYAAKAGVGGLEFLVSIPGTIGGGVIMNAGCYGKEFKDVLIDVEGMTRSGETVLLTPKDLQLSYRRSKVPEDVVITSARLRGQPADQTEIRATMKQMLSNRAASQPVGVRTGGSTFANPDGRKAWQQIHDAGCRGMQRGGARVSEKHCNFLINQGNATAADIEQLGEDVRAAVIAHSGTELRWEIRRMGRLTHPKQQQEQKMAAHDRRVAVLMGGWTSEAAVSRVSASFCSKAARLAGWDSVEVELNRNVLDKLDDIQPDRVFNALHGQIGEDGSVQGLLNILNIPYTHSGVLASATAMDKISSRLIFSSVGITVPPLLDPAGRYLCSAC
ncbi:MAG: hypothetical protein CM15mP100_1170 [Alphaproteobacteria bacterium]|nr:MAG: hypothetical protein CM15mP100_1170 [Alphaproteobacteria bacterium]